MMLDTLRLVFIGGAILCVLLFLLALKKGSEKRSRWLLAGVVLAVLAVAVIVVNNIRIDGNRKALQSSPVISEALEKATPVLTADGRLGRIRENSGNYKVQEPYVLVPIDKVYNWDDRSKDSYEIVKADSCWSGGLFISAEQADQCKTIIFYETSVLEMPYKSSSGSITTGKAESKTAFLYDVESGTLFGYNMFDKNLPSVSKGTPNLKVSTQEILDWVKGQISGEKR